MYICYDKLWKLLLERNIRKTEMSEVAGLNSRTLAKLSKNETVTTDTIARICKALHCDVGDIMEYRDAERPQRCMKPSKIQRRSLPGRLPAFLMPCSSGVKNT